MSSTALPSRKATDGCVVGTRPRGRKEGPSWVVFYKPLVLAALEEVA